MAMDGWEDGKKDGQCQSNMVYYYSIFDSKTTSLIRTLLDSPRDDLNSKILPPYPSYLSSMCIKHL